MAEEAAVNVNVESVPVETEPEIDEEEVWRAEVKQAIALAAQGQQATAEVLNRMTDRLNSLESRVPEGLAGMLESQQATLRTVVSEAMATARESISATPKQTESIPAEPEPEAVAVVVPDENADGQREAETPAPPAPGRKRRRI